MEISVQAAERIRSIRLVVFDVDGVLTDGRIVYDDLGHESKFFDVRDGHGIKLLMRAGIEVALITARDSSAVAHRAANLGITLVYQGMKDKRKALEELSKKTSIRPVEMAYMGDDIIDLPVLKRVGFSATVSDGVSEVKERVDYIARNPGGRGAARELAELILKAQGRWDEIMEHYLA